MDDLNRRDLLKLGGTILAAVARSTDPADADGKHTATEAPAAMNVPDFTRGRWKTTAPLGIIHM